MTEQLWQDHRGIEALEYILIAAGLLVLLFAAFQFLGGAISSFVHRLPSLLGFG